MKFNMLGDANHAGPVRLSDVYNSQVGDASQGVAASQKALYDAYNSLNSSISTINSKLTDVQWFQPTFVSSITDLQKRCAYGIAWNGIKIATISIVITSNNSLIPVNNRTICTIPSKYYPQYGVETMALVIPKSESGWSSTRLEATRLQTDGKIMMGNYIFGEVAIK